MNEKLQIEQPMSEVAPDNYMELERLVENKDLLEKIAEYIVNHWVRKNRDKGKAIEFFISDEKSKIDFVNDVEKELYPLKNKKVLDAGCGKGGVVISCALRGAQAIGVDTDEGELEILKSRIKYQNLNVAIIQADAACLPFENNSFDIVTCTSVLEHVKNVEDVIREMGRVVKSGGAFCIVSPNPLFLREQHYGIFWIPYLPKKLGKLYLKLRGFNPDFFTNHVSYISLARIERLLKNNGMDVQNITKREILERFRDPKLVSSNQGKKVLKILKGIKMSNLVSKISIPFICRGAFIVAVKRN